MKESLNRLERTGKNSGAVRLTSSQRIKKVMASYVTRAKHVQHRKDTVVALLESSVTAALPRHMRLGYWRHKTFSASRSLSDSSKAFERTKCVNFHAKRLKFLASAKFGQVNDKCG